MPEHFTGRSEHEFTQAITPERENLELQALLSEVDRSSDEGLIDNQSYNSVRLRNKLKERGSEAGEEIVGRLWTCQLQDRTTNAELLMYCATKDQAPDIIEAVFDFPAITPQLCQVLEHIGTPAEIPSIRIALERTLWSGDTRSDPLKMLISTGLIRVCEAIGHRSKNIRDKEEIERITQDSILKLSHETGRDLAEWHNWARADVTPSVLNSRKALLFRYPEIDDDFPILAPQIPTSIMSDYERNIPIGGASPHESSFQNAELPTGMMSDYERHTWSGSPFIPYEDPFGYGDEVYDEPYYEKDNEHKTAEQRVNVIRNLHKLGDVGASITQTNERAERRLSRLEYLEENASRYCPTLGIEIEIYKPTVLPEGFEELSETERYNFLDKKLGLFEETRQAGVPRGGDGLWEFANSPVTYYGNLPAEVNELIKLGLINTDFKRHPMHLTIGGVSANHINPDGERDRSVYLFTRMIESTGWSVTGGRIMRPKLLNKPSWLYKGEEGVMQRDLSASEVDDKIGHDIHSAIEIRTLQFQGLSGLTRTLRSTYYIGAGIRASQREHVDQDQTELQLSDVWAKTAKEASSLFTAYGMKDPAREPWIAKYDFDQDNMHLEELDQSYETMASLLDEAAEDPVSRGGEFVRRMQEIVGNSRAECVKILEG